MYIIEKKNTEMDNNYMLAYNYIVNPTYVLYVNFRGTEADLRNL